MSPVNLTYHATSIKRNTCACESTLSNTILTRSFSFKNLYRQKNLFILLNTQIDKKIERNNKVH